MVLQSTRSKIKSAAQATSTSHSQSGRSRLCRGGSRDAKIEFIGSNGSVCADGRLVLGPDRPHTGNFANLAPTKLDQRPYEASLEVRSCPSAIYCGRSGISRMHVESPIPRASQAPSQANSLLTWSCSIPMVTLRPHAILPHQPSRWKAHALL